MRTICPCRTASSTSGACDRMITGWQGIPLRKGVKMSSVIKNDFQLGVEHLVEANREYWKNKSNPVDGDSWIYVLHTLHHQFTVGVLENLVAKGIQAREQLPIASIISGSSDDLMRYMEQIDASYGIEQCFHQSYYDYHSDEIERLAHEMSLQTYNKKDELIHLTYRGIRFGDVLYDDILRRGGKKRRGDVFDCFDIDRDGYRKFIRNALAIIDQAFELFEERKPKYLVVMEYLYTKGLYAHVAKELGAKIIMPPISCPNVVVEIESNERPLSDVRVSEILRATQEKCLAEYRSHDTQHDNLFVLKLEKERHIMGLDKWGEKKNVFILPHCISDAPRESCEHSLYYDYNEWFLDTLRIIRTIPNVNWIIKDHPTSALYGQEEYLKAVFQKNKTENMYFIDKNYSGMSIKNLADCVITCSGDAGIEYWAYGIPTITTAEAYYCKWNISHQMKDLHEYENTLQNIERIAQPPRQSVQLAREYLTAYKNFPQTDDYTSLICKARAEEVAVWNTEGVPYGVHDSVDRQLGKVARNFCESLASMMRETDLELSAIYRLENMISI